VLRAVDTVWLRQPAELRIRVPAALRGQVRSDLDRSRLLLDAARSSGRGVARDELAAAALRGFLAVVGRVTESSSGDSTAVRAGATYVETTLRSDALRAAFTASASFDGRIALDDVGFRRLSYLCEWIEALLDHRSDREHRLRRWAPWAVLAMVPLVTVRIAFGARNLARGKPVSASSIGARTPDGRLGEGELSRVVDGVHLEGPAVGKNNPWHETAFALSTNQEVHPWVTVDLGAPRTLSEAVIYGRSDCCWLSDLPLSIQLSSDNARFVTVATRTTPFTTEFPWRASLGGRRARYVRLYAEGADEQRVVVSELEVYGR
jgi:hypothetical protein